MDPPLDPELELRVHIRSLLLDYVLTHLATNYVTWTQDAVTDVRTMHYLLRTGNETPSVISAAAV